MKRILSLITVFTLLFTACEGDPGPQGPPGANGVNFVGQSFEVDLDFTASNNYQETVEIPLSIDLFESDMVLVYRLVDVVDGFDVWKSLPETIYVNATEEFQYNFEHNFDFVTIFIESHPTFDYNLVLEEERINQIFRVVILPVDLVNNYNIDINNYGDVAQYIQ